MDEVSVNRQFLETGDEVAFEQVFNTYYKIVYDAANKVVRNYEDAEEITNDPFMRAFNELIKQLLRLLPDRDREIVELLLDELSPKEIAERIDSTAGAVQKRWERLIKWLKPVGLHLDALVDCLPEENDRKLMERYLDGQPLSEIAKAIGVSESTIFANNFVELTIDLFELPPEKASEMRDLAGQVAVEVDTLTLLQETRPWVQESIDTGVLSPEDGELVIEAVTGLKVTMPGEDRTASVKNSTIYTEDFTAPEKIVLPESVDSNIPERLED